MLTLLVKKRFHWFTSAVARMLIHAGVTASFMTVVGTMLVIFFSLFYLAQGYWLASASGLLISLLCDVLDGAVARESQNASQAGAFLDSFADRLADTAMFLAVAFYAYTAQSYFLMWLTIITLVVSLLVSYTKARGEGLSVTQFPAGFERPERCVVLLLGISLCALFTPVTVLSYCMVFIAIFSFMTMIQRAIHVYRELHHMP